MADEQTQTPQSPKDESPAAGRQYEPPAEEAADTLPVVTDRELPSEEELAEMAERGYAYIDHAWRPQTRVISAS